MTSLVANLAIWPVGVVCAQTTNSNGSESKASSSNLSERVSKEVAKLETETLEESLSKLSDLNMFNLAFLAFNGAGYISQPGDPLRKEAGQTDLEAVMSNRRFLKVLDDLGKMKKPEATALVNQCLSMALVEYIKLYDAELLKLGPMFHEDSFAGQRSFSGPGFALTSTSGKREIRGTRLNVLSLVWISGILELLGCKEQIERVTNLALNQRGNMYSSKFHPSVKAQILEGFSLYNRQIIGSSLLGVSAINKVQASVVETIGGEWQVRQLVAYNAAPTDFHLQRDTGGKMGADYSRGSSTVKFLSPITDSQFDTLLERIRSKQ
jgi:hypothetical protein